MKMKNFFESSIWKWFKRDFVYLVLVWFSLMACLITLKDIKKFEVQCNNNYISYINNSCFCSFQKPERFNIDTSKYDWIVNITGGYNNETYK